MNKLKGIILVVSICFASIMMPFNIYADTIDSHVRGRNYSYEPVMVQEIYTSTSTKYYSNSGIFHITFELDDEYIGYVLPLYTLRYKNYFYGNSTPSWGTLTTQFNRRVFVNGSSFSFDIPISWNSLNAYSSSSGSDPFDYDSYSFTSSDVTKFADIDSLDQIISILNDLYNSNDQVEGLLNNQLQQLQQIVSNTSLANQYLELISKLKHYNIPFESVGVYTYPLYYHSDKLLYDSVYYDYPIFRLQTNTNVEQFYMGANAEYYFIFLSAPNVYSIQAFNNYFSLKKVTDGTVVNPNIRDFKVIGQMSSHQDNVLYYQVKFIMSVPESGSYYLTTNRGLFFCPIYFGSINNTRISTDFALRNDLSNNVLNNLNIIANGTTASNNASQQLDSDTSDFNTDRDDLIDIENSMGDNMDSAMNQITPNNNGLSGFGGNFLTSAVWVRTQFERLTNNTPYGSLIVYGLTLGLALLLLGKVML